jgi:Transposase
MLYAAIDIHKHAFQAAVLDPDSGEVVEERFAADRDSLARWAERWRGRVAAVAIEATTGWRWVWRELVAGDFEVRLAEPVQTRALLGRRRSAKTDRLDARWLARLLAKEMLPQSWIPPAQIQELRDRTRLRKALAEDRRRWAVNETAVTVGKWTSARKSGQPTLSGKTDRTEPRRKRLRKPFLVSLRCLKKQQHEPSTRLEKVGFQNATPTPPAETTAKARSGEA